MFVIRSEKMSWKKIIAATSSLLYLILISLLFYYYRIDFICGYKGPCLRFCSTDNEKYSNRVLFDSLKKDNISDYYAPKFEEIKFYRGPPECNSIIISIEDVEVKSDYYNSSSPINPHLFEVSFCFKVIRLLCISVATRN